MTTFLDKLHAKQERDKKSRHALALAIGEIEAPPDADDNRRCDECEFSTIVKCEATESDPCPVEDA